MRDQSVSFYCRMGDAINIPGVAVIRLDTGKRGPTAFIDSNAQMFREPILKDVFQRRGGIKNITTNRWTPKGTLPLALTHAKTVYLIGDEGQTHKIDMFNMNNGTFSVKILGPDKNLAFKETNPISAPIFARSE